MPWRQLDDDVLLGQFPLRAFAIDFARNVTLLRLRDGRVLIHSTAPFSAQDVEVMRAFGEPCWLVEATRMHDTFARAGCAALPDVPYLTPNESLRGVAAHPLLPPPAAWDGEIDLLPLEGLRGTNEHVFFHRRSRTLVVADSLFHFPAETRGWPRFFAQHVMRLPQLVGMSIFFRLMIRDRAAFEDSMRKVLAWDFDRIVPGHREPIQENARDILRASLSSRGFNS
ncbi:MAG: hypothetical protein H0X40_09310 [Chthoniobacterales bacterium]|nr:hypothetical protein [Chthoniobacterales bacterium]